jgi:hypothetical protein
MTDTIEAHISKLLTSSEPGDRAMARLLETGILDCLKVFKRGELKDGHDDKLIDHAIGAIISVFVADLLQHAIAMPLDSKFTYAAFVRQTLTDHFDRVFADIVLRELKK